MKKIILAGLSMLFFTHAMAVTSEFAIYVVSAANVKAVAAANNNSVGLLNGASNLVVAPVTGTGSAVSVPGSSTSAGYYSASSSRCPTYCDIQSIASALVSAPPASSTYSKVYNDLTAYPNSNANCIVLNSAFVSNMSKNTSAATVVVVVWTAGTGKNQIQYLCCDSSGQIIATLSTTETSGTVAQITLPKP